MSQCVTTLQLYWMVLKGTNTSRYINSEPNKQSVLVWFGSTACVLKVRMPWDPCLHRFRQSSVPTVHEPDDGPPEQNCIAATIFQIFWSGFNFGTTWNHIRLLKPLLHGFRAGFHPLASTSFKKVECKSWRRKLNQPNPGTLENDGIWWKMRMSWNIIQFLNIS